MIGTHSVPTALCSNISQLLGPDAVIKAHVPLVNPSKTLFFLDTLCV
jgi:hypothetical protein